MSWTQNESSNFNLYLLQTEPKLQPAQQDKAETEWQYLDFH